MHFYYHGIKLIKVKSNMLYDNETDVETKSNMLYDNETDVETSLISPYKKQ